jgi:hypothetical protein
MNYADLDQSYPTGTETTYFGDYKMFGLRGDQDVFCEFYRNGTQGLAESNWKVHISVNPAQLGASWDLVYPILMKKQVDHFKVARQSAQRNKAKFLATTNDGTKEQRQSGLSDIERTALGMQITVYVPLNGELVVQDVLKLIEKKLSSANIIPGEISKSDRPLGTYCSIRNDNSQNGYLSHDQVSSYNPTGEADPFMKKI